MVEISERDDSIIPFTDCVLLMDPRSSCEVKMSAEKAEELLAASGAPADDLGQQALFRVCPKVPVHRVLLEASYVAEMSASAAAAGFQ